VQPAGIRAAPEGKFELRTSGSRHDDYCDLLKVDDAHWNNIKGSGVKVAVVDSGIEKVGAAAAFRDVWDRQNRTQADRIGHGTAMTAIVSDIAPEASVYSEFQAAYREARRVAYSQAVARLQQGATAAATTLLKTMIDPSTPASVRVRAAECVMNHATKAIEIEDIEARVSALEASAGKSGSSR